MIVLLFVAGGCGEREEFVIKCDIAGLGTDGVDMYYTMPGGGVRKASFHPVDGKVELRGQSPQAAVVEVFTLDGGRLFTCLASNGDELEVKLDPSRPESLEIRGNEASEEYARFMADNSKFIAGGGDHEALNRRVAAEVSSKPDKLSSALILATCFDARGHELQADSLIELISGNPEAIEVMGAFVSMVRMQVAPSARENVKPITIRTARDTVARYRPFDQSYSMLVFTGMHGDDSVAKELRRLYRKLSRSRFRALEIAVTGDSASWAASVAGDSAGWMQAWLPGGVGNAVVRPYQVAALPYFIVADSTGRQIYRGRSLGTARDSVARRLKPYLTD